MDLDVTDWWRIVNAALGCVALFLVGRRVVRLWPRWDATDRLMGQAVLVLMVVQLWTTVENEVQQGAWGHRVWMTTASLVWIIVAMLAADRRDTSRRKSSGGVTILHTPGTLRRRKSSGAEHD